MVDFCFGGDYVVFDRPADHQFPGHQGGDDESGEEPAGGIRRGRILAGQERLTGKGFGRAGTKMKKYFLGGLKISSNFV